MQADIPCSEVALGGCFDEFWRSRSADLRRNVRRYLQRAQASGEVSFEVSERPSSELFDAMVRLHALRWQRQGERGMIAANGSESFLRAVTAEFAGRGLVRLFGMRFQGEPVAVILGFVERDKIFGYMSAFDPEHEHLGFGRTLLYEAIRYSFAQGYKAWNFLRGDEAYKTWWGAHPIPRCRVIIRRPAGRITTADIDAGSRRSYAAHRNV